MLFYTYRCVDAFKYVNVAMHLPENFSSISNMYEILIYKKKKNLKKSVEMMLKESQTAAKTLNI